MTPDLDAILRGLHAVKTQGAYVAGDKITIGAAPDCDVRVHDQYASNRHAIITRDPHGQYWIEDCGSTNGTWLNGKIIYAPTSIRRGDRIRIGRSEITW